MKNIKEMFRSYKKSTIYNNLIQLCSPIKLMIDFGKEKQFRDIRVGDTFHFDGRIYKKTKNGKARLVYSNQAFMEMYMKPSDRTELDPNVNKDMIGVIYSFSKYALCQIAVMEFKSFGYDRKPSYEYRRPIFNTNTPSTVLGKAKQKELPAKTTTVYSSKEGKAYTIGDAIDKAIAALK